MAYSDEEKIARILKRFERRMLYLRSLLPDIGVSILSCEQVFLVEAAVTQLVASWNQYLFLYMIGYCEVYGDLSKVGPRYLAESPTVRQAMVKQFETDVKLLRMLHGPWIPDFVKFLNLLQVDANRRSDLSVELDALTFWKDALQLRHCIVHRNPPTVANATTYFSRRFPEFDVGKRWHVCDLWIRRSSGDCTILHEIFDGAIQGVRRLPR